MERSIFRDNDNKCSHRCEMRRRLEEENLPGPTPEEVCNATAALLAATEKAIQNCPMEQIAEEL